LTNIVDFTGSVVYTGCTGTWQGTSGQALCPEGAFGQTPLHTVRMS